MFASLCVLLGVRIVNRRERCAKLAIAGFVGLPVFYVASFGPACWLADRHEIAWKPVWIAFHPLTEAAVRGPRFLANTLIDYGSWKSPAQIPIALELSAEAAMNAWRR